jgi:predicted SprT family Zn-dependent metalloprotease
MSDLISRQAAISLPVKPREDRYFQTQSLDDAYDYGWRSLQRCIEKLPSAEPEQKKGEWIKNDNGTYSCSVCQSWIPKEQHCYARYCLYCGADMRGEKDG